MKGFILYFILMNGLGFGIMGYDKKRAKKKAWRVPEKRLFGIAALGGAIGAWLGMRWFRHKTKHMAFVWGIPALIVWNVVLMYYILVKWIQ